MPVFVTVTVLADAAHTGRSPVCPHDWVKSHGKFGV